MSEPTYLIPTREQVTGLKVGDQAINCYGRMATVTEVTAQRDDIQGRAFVCYYTADGEHGSTISMSIKEGELTRTVALSCRHTSSELDAIERRMRAAQGA